MISFIINDIFIKKLDKLYNLMVKYPLIKHKLT